MNIEKTRCLWISIFCILTLSAAMTVLILYHTSLRFEKQGSTIVSNEKEKQIIHRNTSDGKIRNALLRRNTYYFCAKHFL